MVLIWSFEHKRWCGKNGVGYVDKIDDAGRYTMSDAIAICELANAFAINEAIVPLVDAWKQLGIPLKGVER